MKFRSIYEYIARPKMILGLLMIGVAAVVNTCSSRHLRRSLGLPVDGPIRFIPRRSDIASCNIHKFDGGYIDRFGNKWVRPRGLIIGDFHWDVQIAPNNEKLKVWSNSGKHVNVTQDGRVAH